MTTPQDLLEQGYVTQEEYKRIVSGEVSKTTEKKDEKYTYLMAALGAVTGLGI